MPSIDLNCDMGEAYGPWSLGPDEGIMPYITSANIACGGHAGDPQVMRRTVALAKRHGVSVGAHPGYPDLAGFGRRHMQLTPEEAENIILAQIGALHGVARSEKVDLTHVKPHGALYNEASVNRELADAVARAVLLFSRELLLYCLPGSELYAAGEDCGLSCIREGFVDRSYQPNGLLVSREEAGGVIVDVEDAVSQAVDLANGTVGCTDGSVLRIKVGTLCLHGDTLGASERAKRVREGLEASGFIVLSPS